MVGTDTQQPVCERSGTRLVSFLGLGDYDEKLYVWPGEGEARTEYTAVAIGRLTGASEILVLATDKARNKHWGKLCQRLKSANLPEPQPGPIPEGGSPEELWKQFAVIKDSLRPSGMDRVVLDITLGFRSQPFFAAAVVSFVQAVDENPPDFRVVYAATERGEERAQIWNLTGFVDLLRWTQAIMLFQRTGRAEGIAHQTKAFGARLGHQDAPRNPIENLGEALGQFGEDLETVRTGALLLGRELYGQRFGSSAQELLKSIEQARDDRQSVPSPLADVLDRLHGMVSPLSMNGGTLVRKEGHRTVAALARLYLGMGRYAEAAATLREGVINLSTDDPNLASPGLSHQSDDGRAELSKWHDTRDRMSGEIKSCRNDIEHAGYGRRPRSAAELKAELERLMAEFEARTREDAHARC